MSESNTFYIENLGCFKNQVDAEYIISALQQKGYIQLDSPEKAEIIFVNTCSFIESAKQESIDTFFELKKARPDAKVIISGCLAERYGKDLLDMIPEADGLFGNRDPGQADKFVEMLSLEQKPILFPPNMVIPPRRKKFLSPKGSVYVKIAEGCSNACTFCAIPLFRGGLESRTIDDVSQEINELLDAGILEINLIAQDLASYGMDRGNSELQRLMEKILERSGQFWIRPLYLYPDRFPEFLLDLCRQDTRILPYFDLPFQHASSRVLKRMGRKGDSSVYLDIIDRIRGTLPDAALRSTFIVGFPGETEEDFQELLKFQEKAKIHWAGVFAYSHEEGTPAYKLQSESAFDLFRPVAQKRKELFEDRQAEITSDLLKAWVGKTLDVLIEEPIKGAPMALGRSYLQAQEVDGLVLVHAPNLNPGDFVKVKIEKVNGVDLEAHLIK